MGATLFLESTRNEVCKELGHVDMRENHLKGKWYLSINFWRDIEDSHETHPLSILTFTGHWYVPETLPCPSHQTQ